MSDLVPAPFDCQSCGACCSYSADWPRFSVESDAALDLIPPALVAADLSGMACEDGRCRALAGCVGEGTSCTIYAIRPEVCRECQPGDPECLIARRAHGLPVDGMSRTQFQVVQVADAPRDRGEP